MRALVSNLPSSSRHFFDLPLVLTFMEQGFNLWTMGAIRGVGAPKGTPDAVVDYLEGRFKKLTEDPEFHAIMRDIAHPVLFRERKVFLKKMLDGFDTYGQLLDALGFKTEKK